jgi:glucosamine--fructose-6-phosphate aminotransferase (isomerizing)
MTIAVTNRPESDLGRMAHEVLDVRAGPEMSVAATKSYTGQLVALVGLFADDATFASLSSLPTWAGRCWPGVGSRSRRLPTDTATSRG